MKRSKLSFIIAGAIAALGFAPSAYAFHNGGVAYCEGCHTMHNSLNNTPINNHKAVDQGVPYLLKGSDQSSTCLNCHSGPTQSSYHVLTYPIPGAGIPPQNQTPGGDFAYLQKNYGTWLPRGTAIKGMHHGHNVVAADFGLTNDTDITFAPGGSYLATKLNCISCHDPHSNLRIVDAAGALAGTVTGGTGGAAVFGVTKPIGMSGSYPGAFPSAEEAVGVYRLLGGIGYVPLSYTGGPAFGAMPPYAVAPSTYNRTEAATDTRVAYGQGMSEWCANCHGQIHNPAADMGTKMIHPTGALAKLSFTANIAGFTTTNANIYNAYVKSGDLGGGTGANAYLSLVPYEEGTQDRATLAKHAVNDGSYTQGPNTGNENVMCLSCHRAHASAFSSMTRWAPNSEFIITGGQWPGIDRVGDVEAIGNSNGMTQAEYAKAMYDQPASKFAVAQRVLCNKCHAKD